MTYRLKTDPCPWHPTKHAWSECPKRCTGTCERRSKGRRYVNARWQCAGKAIGNTGRCRSHAL